MPEESGKAQIKFVTASPGGGPIKPPGETPGTPPQTPGGNGPTKQPSSGPFYSVEEVAKHIHRIAGLTVSASKREQFGDVLGAITEGRYTAARERLQRYGLLTEAQQRDVVTHSALGAPLQGSSWSPEGATAVRSISNLAARGKAPALQTLLAVQSPAEQRAIMGSLNKGAKSDFESRLLTYGKEKGYFSAGAKNISAERLGKENPLASIVQASRSVPHVIPSFEGSVAPGPLMQRIAKGNAGMEDRIAQMESGSNTPNTAAELYRLSTKQAQRISEGRKTLPVSYKREYRALQKRMETLPHGYDLAQVEIESRGMHVQLEHAQRSYGVERTPNNLGAVAVAVQNAHAARTRMQTIVGGMKEGPARENAQKILDTAHQSYGGTLEKLPPSVKQLAESQGALTYRQTAKKVQSQLGSLLTAGESGTPASQIANIGKQRARFHGFVEANAGFLPPDIEKAAQQLGALPGQGSTTPSIIQPSPPSRTPQVPGLTQPISTPARQGAIPGSSTSPQRTWASPFTATPQSSSVPRTQQASITPSLPSIPERTQGAQPVTAPGLLPTPERAQQPAPTPGSAPASERMQPTGTSIPPVSPGTTQSPTSAPSLRVAAPFTREHTTHLGRVQNQFAQYTAAPGLLGHKAFSIIGQSAAGERSVDKLLKNLITAGKGESSNEVKALQAIKEELKGTRKEAARTAGGFGGKYVGIAAEHYSTLSSNQLFSRISNDLGVFGKIAKTVMGVALLVTKAGNYAQKFLLGKQMPWMKELVDTSNVGRLVGASTDTVLGISRPGKSRFTNQEFANLGYTGTEATQVLGAYGIKGGMRGDLTSILKFSRMTGVSAQQTASVAQQGSIMGAFAPGHASDYLSRFSQVMAKALKEGIDQSTAMKSLSSTVSTLGSAGMLGMSMGSLSSLVGTMMGTGYSAFRTAGGVASTLGTVGQSMMSIPDSPPRFAFELQALSSAWGGISPKDIEKNAPQVRAAMRKDKVWGAYKAATSDYTRGEILNALGPITAILKPLFAEATKQSSLMGKKSPGLAAITVGHEVGINNIIKALNLMKAVKESGSMGVKAITPKNVGAPVEAAYHTLVQANDIIVTASKVWFNASNDVLQSIQKLAKVAIESGSAITALADKIAKLAGLTASKEAAPNQGTIYLEHQALRPSLYYNAPTKGIYTHGGSTSHGIYTVPGSPATPPPSTHNIDMSPTVSEGSSGVYTHKTSTPNMYVPKQYISPVPNWQGTTGGTLNVPSPSLNVPSPSMGVHHTPTTGTVPIASAAAYMKRAQALMKHPPPHSYEYTTHLNVPTKAHGPNWWGAWGNTPNTATTSVVSSSAASHKATVTHTHHHELNINTHVTVDSNGTGEPEHKLSRFLNSPEGQSAVKSALEDAFNSGLHVGATR